MNIFLLLLSLVFGAIVGSFLNVVIYRFGTGTIHKGRSMCFSCGTTLQVRDLVPIFSFLFLRGKCRTCSTKISPQYIVVETIMSVAAAALFFKVMNLLMPAAVLMYVFVYTVVFAILVAIAVYDFYHKIIPDELSLSFSVLAFFLLFFNQGHFVWPTTYDLLAGPILAAPCAALFFFSGGKWMGLGDAKLFLGVGWFLGLVHGLSAFVLSFWIGSIVSIVLLYTFRKKIHGNTQVPFAPFIIVATLIVFFSRVDIFGIEIFFQ